MNYADLASEDGEGSTAAEYAPKVSISSQHKRAHLAIYLAPHPAAGNMVRTEKYG